MTGGEEVSSRLHLSQSVQTDLGIACLSLGAKLGHHLQDLHIGYELFVGNCEAPFEPSGGMDDNGCARHETSPEAELSFIGGLGIAKIGSRPGCGPPRQTNKTRELAGGERGAEVFRRAEGGSAGLHVYV